MEEMKLDGYSYTPRRADCRFYDKVDNVALEYLVHRIRTGSALASWSNSLRMRSSSIFASWVGMNSCIS